MIIHTLAFVFSSVCFHENTSYILCYYVNALIEYTDWNVLRASISDETVARIWMHKAKMTSTKQPR